jgi:hypothetical protein
MAPAARDRKEQIVQEREMAPEFHLSPIKLYTKSRVFSRQSSPAVAATASSARTAPQQSIGAARIQVPRLISPFQLHSGTDLPVSAADAGFPSIKTHNTCA